MRVTAIIQARTGSSRFPGKVLREIEGLPLLQRMLQRVERCREIDRIAIATGESEADDDIASLAAAGGVGCFRGSETDVLDRYYRAARSLSCEGTAVVRLTADCPLIDPELVDRVVARFREGDCDYASNIDPPTWPDGLDTEVFERTLHVRRPQLQRA